MKDLSEHISEDLSSEVHAQEILHFGTLNFDQLQQEIGSIVEVLRRMDFQGQFFTEIRKGKCDNPVIEFEKIENSSKTAMVISRFMTGYFLVVAEYANGEVQCVKQERFPFCAAIIEYLVQYGIRQDILRTQQK